MAEGLEAESILCTHVTESQLCGEDPLQGTDVALDRAERSEQTHEMQL
jgi:hypothetical protein